MNQQEIRKTLKSDYLLLPLIKAVAFYLVFIPHQGYPYPVHLDEWIHLACSNQIIEQTSAVGLTDPFFGGEPMMNSFLRQVSIQTKHQAFLVLLHFQRDLVKKLSK